MGRKFKGLVAIVAGWYWVMSRLGPLPDQSEDDGEYEPLYLVYKPGLTKTLMWSAIACGVFAALVNLPVKESAIQRGPAPQGA